VVKGDIHSNPTHFHPLPQLGLLGCARVMGGPRVQGPGGCMVKRCVSDARRSAIQFPSWMATGDRHPPISDQSLIAPPRLQTTNWRKLFLLAAVLDVPTIYWAKQCGRKQMFISMIQWLYSTPRVPFSSHTKIRMNATILFLPSKSGGFFFLMIYFVSYTPTFPCSKSH